MMDLSIVIPCLNERNNVIGSIQSSCRAAEAVGCQFEVLVVDDGSADGTADVVKAFIEQNPHLPIKLHINSTNCGLSRSFVDAAFRAKGKYIRLCCGDNVESWETLAKIFSRINKVDLALPYQPYVPGRTFVRRVLSKTYTFIVNSVTGYRVKYYNGCPLMRTGLFIRWHSRSTGFGFQADTVARLLDEGVSYEQFPVDVVERQHGNSKALTYKNLLSTAHVFVELAARRARRRLDGRKEGLVRDYFEELSQ